MSGRGGFSPPLPLYSGCEDCQTVVYWPHGRIYCFHPGRSATLRDHQPGTGLAVGVPNSDRHAANPDVAGVHWHDPGERLPAHSGVGHRTCVAEHPLALLELAGATGSDGPLVSAAGVDRQRLHAGGRPPGISAVHRR